VAHHLDGWAATSERNPDSVWNRNTRWCGEVGGETKHSSCVRWAMTDRTDDHIRQSAQRKQSTSWSADKPGRQMRDHLGEGWGHDSHRSKGGGDVYRGTGSATRSLFVACEKWRFLREMCSRAEEGHLTTQFRKPGRSGNPKKYLSLGTRHHRAPTRIPANWGRQKS